MLKMTKGFLCTGTLRLRSESQVCAQDPFPDSAGTTAVHGGVGGGSIDPGLWATAIKGAGDEGADSGLGEVVQYDLLQSWRWRGC